MKSLKYNKIFQLWFLTALLFSLTVTPGLLLAETYSLTILHTNDHHGHFARFDPYPVQDVGGLAAQSTLVNIVRAEVEKKGGYTLLLSAGDVNTGVPESDMLDAEPDFKFMNILGYDAMTLGNHEFDKPLDVLVKQKGWAKFPFLSGNIIKRKTGESLFDPYIIKELGGLKVAILGLTTEETPILVNPENVKDLEFKSAIETAKVLIPKLRAEADLVIALTHLGFYEESGGKYRAPGDFKLAREVGGIDVIVGGHSHTVVRDPKVIENTIIIQAGDWSRYVGRLDLTVNTDTDRITDYRYTLIPVNLKHQVRYRDQSYYVYVDKGYVEDKKILDMTVPYLKNADRVLSQPLGRALVRLNGERNVIRSRETNLANLVADSMRMKTGAEIAFLNAGGVRDSIPKGPITYRDILKVLPFGSTLVLMEMTGKEIMDVLNYAVTVKPGNGAFLQVSGLTWTNNKGRPERVKVGDTDLSLEKSYRVAVNSFMAAGGDGYAMLKGIHQVDTGFVDADALREYVVKTGNVAPKVEGRLIQIP